MHTLKKQRRSQHNRIARAARLLEALETRRFMDATYHALAGSEFNQNWNDTNQISASDNWSGVPSVLGFLSGLGTASGTDPATITGTSTNVDVNANQTNPNQFVTGGVTEFELENPTIAMAGSNSAGSPYIMFHMDSTGVDSVDISYNVRDLDSTADNAVQRAALQYRTSPSGTWTNVPEGYVADGTTAGTATQVTPIAVTLPSDAGNQPQLQVRVIVGNAAGNDEPLGIDDIVIKKTPIILPPGNFQVDARGVRVSEDGGSAVVTVTRQGGTGGSVTVDYATSDLTATAGLDYTAAVGTLTFADGESTKDILIPLLSDNDDERAESLSVTLSNPTGGAGLNPSSSNVVTLVDTDGHRLSSGPLTQNWNDIDLISESDNWNNVFNITGYMSDADRDAGVVDVIANQLNPTGQSQGGVAEFENGDPTIALQGSNAAPAPQIVFDLDTTGVNGLTVSFDAIDLDGSADNATQNVSVSYRVGASGDFVELYFLEDATEGPSIAGLITPISFALPADVEGQSLVQIRISTTNAAGNDEWVGIDNISIASGVVTPAPELTSSSFDFETGPSMTLVFSQDVQASLDASDLVIENTTTGQVLAASDYTMSSSLVAGTTTTVLGFTTALANGDYRVRVLAGGVQAASGPANAADLSASFFSLAGDTNRDRTVNFDDLLTLAQNYGQSGRTFSQGNFDYSADGAVSFDDLLLLAQNYGRNLFSAVAVRETAVVTKSARRTPRVADILG
jgi:hypothetical protein